mgnify:CR=1 FL=1
MRTRMWCPWPAAARLPWPPIRLLCLTPWCDALCGMLSYQAAVGRRARPSHRAFHATRAANAGLYGQFDTSGMETKEMNLFTALNDGMRAALAADESAVRDHCG